MSSSAIRAGAAYVEIVTKDNRLIKGLASAGKRLQAFGATVTGIGMKIAGVGAAAVGGLAALAKGFSDAGGTLADMSQRTGISVEALSALGFAAEQSGADMETLEASVRKMQTKIADLSGGNKTVKETFDKLGISLTDLADKSPDEQLVTIGDAISKIKDPALRASTAMDVFGKAGTKLLPMFANGADGVNELVKQAQELGLVWSGKAATDAEAFGDTLDVAWKVIKKVAIEIGAALVPDLKALAESVTSIGAKTIAWVKQNQELIAMVGRVAAGVLAAGVALVVVGGIISGVGTAIGAAIAVVGGIGAAFSAVAAVVGTILSPIGLVVAAIVGLAGYFLYASGTAESVANFIGEAFATLAEDAKSSFGAIGEALAAGDIAAAAQVLWTLLKMEWKRGIAWLNAKWLDWKTFFINVWNNAVASVATFFTNIWAGIEVAFIETIDFLSDTFSVFASFIQKTWNSTVGFIKKVWTRLKGLFTDIDVEAEVKAIENDVAGKNAGVDDGRNKAIGDRDQKRRQNEKDIEKQRAGTAANIEQDRLRKEREAQAAMEKELAADKAEIDAARAAWETAKSDARTAGANGPRLQAAKQAVQNMPDGDELRNQAKDKAEIAGTFNAAVVGGLGSDEVQDQQLEEQRQMKKYLRVMALNRGNAQFT